MSSSNLRPPPEVLARGPLPYLDDVLTVAVLLDTVNLPSTDPPFTGTTPKMFPLTDTLPSMDLDDLRQRCIPDLDTLSITMVQVLEARNRVVRAVLDDRPGRPPAAIPVWMLVYWMRMRTAVHAREMWTTCRADMLRLLAAEGEQPSSDRDVLIVALASLARLRWNISLSDSPKFHSRDMVTLLLHEPLSPQHISMLLHVFRRELQNTYPQASADTAIHGIPFQNLLREVLNSPPGRADERKVTLATGLSFPLRGDPPRVKTAYIPWLTGRSWGLYALESSGRTIRYGSMTRTAGPAPDFSLVQRWLRMCDLGEWTFGQALRFGGPDDGVSGGFAMVNALRHEVLGEPLWTPALREIIRVREYVAICRYLNIID